MQAINPFHENLHAGTSMQTAKANPPLNKPPAVSNAMTCKRTLQTISKSTIQTLSRISRTRKIVGGTPAHDSHSSAAISNVLKMKQQSNHGRCPRAHPKEIIQPLYGRSTLQTQRYHSMAPSQSEIDMSGPCQNEQTTFDAKKNSCHVISKTSPPPAPYVTWTLFLDTRTSRYAPMTWSNGLMVPAKDVSCE